MASGSNIERSPHYGALQDLVDGLFASASADDAVRRLDAVIAAEAADLPDDLKIGRASCRERVSNFV